MHDKNINSMNDTEAPAEDVTALIKEFNNFAVKTVEGVLAMALTVHKAQQLGDSKFELFCKGIRYDAKSSAMRKLAVIGAKHEILSKNVAALPATWTTIYRIAAKMDNRQLGEAVESGKVFPGMTAKDLAKLLGHSYTPSKNKGRQTSSTEVPNGTDGDIVVRFSTTLSGTQLEAVRKVQALLRELGATIEFSDNLEAALSPVALEEAA